jgi:hypothetical protein
MINVCASLDQHGDRDGVTVMCRNPQRGESSLSKLYAPPTQNIKRKLGHGKARMQKQWFGVVIRLVVYCNNISYQVSLVFKILRSCVLQTLFQQLTIASHCGIPHPFTYASLEVASKIKTVVGNESTSPYHDTPCRKQSEQRHTRSARIYKAERLQAMTTCAVTYKYSGQTPPRIHYP